MGGLGTIVYQANLTGSPEPVPGPETDSGLSLMPEVDRFRRAQSGCPDAFASLVDEYGPRILHYLRRWTGNEHDAEDLTQETFLKAYRGLARCSHVRALNGWLFTIARRTALNFQRARQCRPWPVQEISQELEEPRNLGSDAGDRLWEMARALPHEYYEVLWLRYGEDLSVSEVARVLGISGLNVRVRLHRARRQLRGQLTVGRGPGQEPEGGSKQAIKSNVI